MLILLDSFINHTFPVHMALLKSMFGEVKCPTTVKQTVFRKYR